MDVVHEFEIPVPWGHVAVKAWGSEENTAVLVAHGMNDNAGSFDRLIPHLPRSFYYICFEQPGHGKSSHFPAHVPIHLVNCLFTYKIITDHLAKKDYIIIGHSWGGILAILFAQLYPALISKLILLDIVYPYPVSVEFFKHHFKERINHLNHLSNKIAKRAQPTYTYEDALDRCCKNRTYGELEREAGRMLLKRSLLATKDGKFKFANDPRTGFYINTMFDERFVNELMQKYPIACPVLFVITTDCVPLEQYFKSLLKKLMKNNNACFVRKVLGNHDVHMTHPEIVAPMINAFLHHPNSKL